MADNTVGNKKKIEHLYKKTNEAKYIINKLINYINK